MSRVVSKHLFNYQLNGVMDDEVIQLEQLMLDDISKNPEMVQLKRLVDSEKLDVNSNIIPRFMDRMLDRTTSGEPIIYRESIDRCTHTEFIVPPRDGNDYNVPVHVHTPFYLVGKKSNAAIIYAHTGGVVGGDVHICKGMLSHLALQTGVVFFNVGYRLAPETKFPKNTLDFYCAMKHIIEHAEELGIDACRIAISGDSGGGYIVFSTMVMLAQREEAGLIKLALPKVAQIDDYCFTDILSMTKEEREAAYMMRKIWTCIANDLSAERNNPLLFPSKASDELLQKMPPTIIWENEFDYFITENARMAHRMRIAGRLLEFRVQPGMSHLSTFIPGLKGFKQNIDDFKLAIKEYLL